MSKLKIALLLGGLTAPALGADYLAMPEEPAPNPWSRPYIGVFGGIGSGTMTYETNLAPSEISASAGGLEAGIRAGYDFAQDSFLVGIVADYAVTNIGLTGSLSVPGLTAADAEYRLSSLGTLRARLGVTSLKNNLFYAHGGAAVGTMSIAVDGDEVPGIIDNPRLGYAVGVGHEYAIGAHGTIQTEYSFVQLSKFDVYSTAGVSASDQLSFHKISSGVNFRF